MSRTPLARSQRPNRPRKRDAARTKREILTVAGRLFARSGYTRVSLQEIAAEVGVTAAMISHHFGSKAELFAAVASDEWEIDSQQIEHVGKDMGEMARRLVDYWYDINARSPSLALVRSLDQEEAVVLFRAELERRVFRPWRKRLTGPDAELRIKMITGFVMGFGYFTTGALLDPDAPPPGDERDKIVMYLTRLLDMMVADE
jgi:AcrR family transcriptional regulator